MLHYTSPTKIHMMVYKNDPNVKSLYKHAFLKRPAEELYDLKKDPYQMNNIAYKEEYEIIKNAISQKLDKYLIETEDPRVLGEKIIWDSTTYYMKIDFIPKPSKDAVKRLKLKTEYNYLEK
jgi:hypothetical protein